VVIETMTFRLAAGADEAAFVDADTRVQREFAYAQRGLLRRTTARGMGDRAGEWVVVDLWYSAEAADDCAVRWETDPVVADFLTFVDPATVEVRRYEDLGG
jgi:hypothetical protein